VRKKDASNEKNIYENIAKEVGTSYLMVAYTSKDSRRMKNEMNIEDMVGVGTLYHRMMDISKTADESAVIEVKSIRVSATNIHQQVVKKTSIVNKNGTR